MKEKGKFQKIRGNRKKKKIKVKMVLHLNHVEIWLNKFRMKQKIGRRPKRRQKKSYRKKEKNLYRRKEKNKKKSKKCLIKGILRIQKA